VIGLLKNCSRFRKKQTAS